MTRPSITLASGLVAAAILTTAPVLLPKPFGGDALGSDPLVLGEIRRMLDDPSQADLAQDLHRADALETHYGDSAALVIWVRDDGLASDGRELEEAMARADDEGLDPEVFRTSAVADALRRLRDEETPDAAARAELLLSDAFLRLADALARGITEPGAAGLEWGIERDSVPHAALLASVARGASPDEILVGLEPTMPWYDAMKEALVEFREAEGQGGWPSVPVGDLLEHGDTGPRVAAVRQRLRAGMDPRVAELASRGDTAPETFDPSLAEAVRLFQERHGIPADSLVGETTIRAMNVTAGQRVNDLELNLDRIRRMPRDLGPRSILVNVAGFELAVLEGAEPVMEMGVVVGQPEWRTAIFQDEMEYLVVNPYWHVPESIEAEETLPALREDPGYLAAQNLVLVDEDDNFGPPQPTEGIDWESVDPESFPYDFRQEPGPSNALGLVKFMFPNEHNIYLHDTPADHLFTEDFRAFSHGCIRVERPEELARYVLRHASDAPPSRFDELVRTGERTQIDLTHPIPVYITYFTAWVEPDGSVRFYPDLYDRDAALKVTQGIDEPGR